MSEREKLPKERSGVTHHFEIMHLVRDETNPNDDGHVEVIDGYVTTSCYPDGRLGELFVRIGKMGETARMLDSWAKACSHALQLGADVDTFFGMFLHDQYQPAGRTNNKQIPSCSSLTDYISKYIILKYGKPQAQPVDQP